MRLRRTFVLLITLILCCLPALCQPGGGGAGNVVMYLGSGAPSGSCGSRALYTNTTSGALYNCKGGVWNLLSSGGGGVSSVGLTQTGTFFTITGSPVTTSGNINLAPGILPILNGGTGTATPSLVAGTNVTITGSWPDQTINSTAGGGNVSNSGTPTPGFFAQWVTDTTHITNGACDYGVTTANTVTCNATGGINASGYGSSTANGGWWGVEGTGANVTSHIGVGNDVCYFDSTAHAAKCSFNNDTASQVARFANNLSVFAATTSAQLAGVISDETGSGALVFGTSPALTTPNLGTPSAVTLTNGTGLPAASVLAGALASGMTATTQSAGDNSTKVATTAYVDGTATPLVSVDTTTPITVSTTRTSAFYNNQNATAATAVTYNLPTAAAGKQFCFTNSYNGTAADTGVLTVATSATGQFIIFTDGTLSATGGNVTSGGAASDSACVVGVDATHWQLFVQRGTWTKH